MLTLDRTRAQEPHALKQAKREKCTWDNLSSEQRSEIRQCLAEWQHHLCAYCERPIKTGSATPSCHIEHFLKRDLFPGKTFEWSNLFLSCSNEDTCGKAKDKSIKRNDAQKNESLIAPGKACASIFVVTALGRMGVHEACPQELRERAQLIIDAFNLNDIKLVSQRKNIFKQFKDLPDCSCEEQIELLTSIIDKVGFPSVFDELLGIDSLAEVQSYLEASECPAD